MTAQQQPNQSEVHARIEILIAWDPCQADNNTLLADFNQILGSHPVNQVTKAISWKGIDSKDKATIRRHVRSIVREIEQNGFGDHLPKRTFRINFNTGTYIRLQAIYK